ncbi:hypothetical protein P7K49_003587, partial [Saguinus oedipus]
MTFLENDPRWLIANISGLKLPVEAQRTRGCHTFGQIFVTHGAEDSQWRSPTCHQHDSCGRRSSFAGTSAWQLLVQSERDWFHSDQRLELWEGRVAYYKLKKEARLEIPRQKSTISLNATVLAGA